MDVLFSRRFFLRSAGMAFGSWLFYLGLMKWVAGSPVFVERLMAQFSQSWPPVILVSTLAWIILFAEPLLGLVLAFRPMARLAWSLVALLMLLLTFGQTILGNFEVVSNNFQYFAFCIFCAAMCSDRDAPAELP